MAEVITINEEALIFYHELGVAITQWASVEFALNSIVAACFSTQDAARAVNGFRSIENFRSRLQYVDTMIRSRRMAPDERANWSTLMDRCSRSATKRNKLAHHWVLHNLTARAGRRVMLLPGWPRSVEKKGRAYRGAICVRDIAGYRQEFHALMQELENFCRRLSGQKERFQEPPTLPQRPPTLIDLRRKIYAYAARQPRPSRG